MAIFIEISSFPSSGNWAVIPREVMMVVGMGW
jgi:hypothetical protein